MRYLYQIRIRFLEEKYLSAIPTGVTVYKHVQCFDVVKSSAEDRYIGSVELVSVLQQV